MMSNGSKDIGKNEIDILEPMQIDATQQIPGQEDVLVQLGHGEKSMPLVFLTGSDDPNEYLLRARFNSVQVMSIMEAMGDFNEMYSGETDLPGVIAYLANASGGQDGKARGEALAAIKGGIFGAVGSSATKAFGRMSRNYQSR